MSEIKLFIMKKSFTIIALLISVCIYAQNHVTRTLSWDGVQRQYLEYVPTIYNPENPAPVIFCLHGLGDNMTNFSGVGFDNVADQKGWIVITPQALDATVPIVGNIGAAWNSGAAAEFPYIGYTIVNEGVDDSGFLMAVLDSLENHYNINTDSVFFMGFSLGGFMTNRMAIEHGDRINGVVSVSGTIGTEMIAITPVTNVNTMHIHGTADATIAYADAGLDTGMGVYSIGLGAEQTTDFWRNFNVCNVDPIITNFPDTHADGKTFERYLYEGGNNESRSALIKVYEGDHEWYYLPQNDIDYTTEIFKFLTNTMDFPSGLCNNMFISDFNIYPNPADNVITVKVENFIDCELVVMDITGKILLKSELSNQETNFDISAFSEGMYIVRINENGKSYESKLIITR